MNSFQPPNLPAQPAHIPAQPAHIPAALGAAPAPPAQMPEQQTNGTGEDVPLQQVIAQGAVPGLRLAIPDQQLGENPMSSYLTLGCSVEERIKTKIWQGLYIELTCLASLGGPQASVSLNWSGQHPSICMAPPKSAPITSYWEWLTLFRTYASIYLEVHTQEGPALFTYTERVGELHRNFPKTLIWLEYDRKFRLQKAVDKNLPWQKVELQILWPMMGMRQQESLATPFVDNNMNRDNTSTSQRASGGEPPADTCTSYYFKGFCKKQFKGCGYHHLCGHCHKPGHPLTKCPSSSP